MMFDNIFTNHLTKPGFIGSDEKAKYPSLLSYAHKHIVNLEKHV